MGRANLHLREKSDSWVLPPSSGHYFKCVHLQILSLPVNYSIDRDKSCDSSKRFFKREKEIERERESMGKVLTAVLWLHFLFLTEYQNNIFTCFIVTGYYGNSYYI